MPYGKTWTDLLGAFNPETDGTDGGRRIVRRVEPSPDYPNVTRYTVLHTADSGDAAYRALAAWRAESATPPAERVEHVELLPVGRRPLDDDTGADDGSGTLRVTFARYSPKQGACLNVTIRATGDYATWTRDDLKAEAAYLLGN